MHTKKTRYFRTEEEATAFVEVLKKPQPASEAYVRSGPALDTVVFQDTQLPAWQVTYEEYTG